MTGYPTKAALILAAGRGSRMKGFEGNKTLLPLLPGPSVFRGRHPLLAHILENLPPGPKALVVNHKKEEVMEATRSLGLVYCEQPVLNGTGGALLAARDFLTGIEYEHLIVTMGDVPFVRSATYTRLVDELARKHLAILGFRPADKRQYGVLELDNGRVARIVEWKYWKDLPKERKMAHTLCNSGIYAFRKDPLVHYLPILQERPHTVLKDREGKVTEIQEFFITDLAECFHRDGLEVGYVAADDEDEVMGIDDLPSLEKAQKLFKGKFHR